MVGLFVVTSVGICVLVELWTLLDIKKGLSMKQFGKHFGARALCLIALPLAMYLSYFYLHFIILTKSGPGDSFMSTRFQQELAGNEVATQSTGKGLANKAIPFGSNITFKNKALNVFLHSHKDRYPLRYEDDRISSQGQQVTGYPHKDDNNLWTIEPVDENDQGEPILYEHTAQEMERGVRYVKDGDFIRLLHIRTNSYLMTHDVASPLTTTNMEMTTWPHNDTSRFKDTIWKLETTEGEEGAKLMSKRDTLKIISRPHNVAVYTHKGKLPKWGFDQLEVNGNKNLKESSGSVWYVDDVEHARIQDGLPSN